ncbi:MAG TPA: aspartyl protease family protein [Clostridiales bacterium]|nr:aspartyl protease family protein [Clostridiales bacterium]
MKVEYRDGLLFTTIELVQDGKRKIIENIVIDIGASNSVISQNCVDDIDIRFTGKEEIVTTFGIGGKEHAFVKKIDKIILGDLVLEGYEADFAGYMYKRKCQIYEEPIIM